MDVNVIRIVVTVLSFFIFGGIVAWALNSRNRPAFDEAQQLPFLETGADQ
jgi:cytochrome c oxidase cbb3-type subunit 4